MKYEDVRKGMRVKMQGRATLHYAYMRCSINDEFDTWFYGTVIEIESNYHIADYYPKALVKFDDKRLSTVRINHWDLQSVSLREDDVYRAIEQKAKRRWRHLLDTFME